MQPVLAGFMVILGGSLVSCNNFVRDQGMFVNDWCDGIEVCSFSGAQCLADTALQATSSGFQRFCKCRQGYTEYAAPTGSTRCAAAQASIGLTDAECELDSDCQNFGASTTCRTTALNRFGRCGCADGYVYDTTTRTCRVFDCTDNPTRCLSLVIGSVCSPRTSGRAVGRCVCPAGKILVNSGTVCLDLAAYACSAVDRPCPAGLTCSANGRCACPPIIGTGVNANAINYPASYVTSATGEASCRANTVGSECTTDDQCPRNAICKGTTAPKRCICKDLHKLVTLDGAPAASCEVPLGACCKAPGDCGLVPLTGGGFTCLKTVSTDTAGVCGCPKGLSWNPTNASCSNTCAVPI